MEHRVTSDLRASRSFYKCKVRSEMVSRGVNTDTQSSTGIMHASTLVLIFTSPMSVALNYTLVYKTDLGFLGAPVATSITYWVSFFLLCGE